MMNEMIGAILQIFVFTIIPFLVYVIQNKKVEGFFNYLGLKRSTKKANALAVLACLIFAAPLLILTLTSPAFEEIMLDPNSIIGKFRVMGFGIHTLSILLIIALFKTSFAEEVLFRGFFAKRLISVLGFEKGNILQAVIFGLIHAVLFAFITTDIVFLTVIFFIPSVGAYVSTYLNEKMANGSIIPGWISHGLANTLAYSTVAFVI